MCTSYAAIWVLSKPKYVFLLYRIHNSHPDPLTPTPITEQALLRGPSLLPPWEPSEGGHLSRPPLLSARPVFGSGRHLPCVLPLETMCPEQILPA